MKLTTKKPNLRIYYSNLKILTKIVKPLQESLNGSQSIKLAYAISQLTGCKPLLERYLLERENGLDPKKPL